MTSVNYDINGSKRHDVIKLNFLNSAREKNRNIRHNDFIVTEVTDSTTWSMTSMMENLSFSTRSPYLLVLFHPLLCKFSSSPEQQQNSSINALLDTARNPLLTPLFASKTASVER